MKQEEIRQMSIKDLKERLLEERTVLNKLKLSHAVSPIENPMKVRVFRRNIARLRTELRRRELEELQGGSALPEKPVKEKKPAAKSKKATTKKVKEEVAE